MVISITSHQHYISITSNQHHISHHITSLHSHHITVITITSHHITVISITSQSSASHHITWSSPSHHVTSQSSASHHITWSSASHHINITSHPPQTYCLTIENNQRTKNDVIIHEWRWWVGASISGPVEDVHSLLQQHHYHYLCQGGHVFARVCLFVCLSVC